MAATPDHRAQTAYRDTEVQLGNSGAQTVVSAPGGQRYNGTGFQFLDSAGQYDPRTVFVTPHGLLNDLIHAMGGGGPALNGAYKVTTYVGGVFLSTETWYTNAARTTPISQHRLTYPAGSYVNPTTEVWVVYDAAGAVLHTITDTLTFSGVTEVARSRSYS